MDKKQLYRQVAALHVANIDQGFLSTLGTQFVALMYEVLDATDGSVLLVEERDGDVAGFVAGSEGMGVICRGMLRRPVRLALALAPSLLRPSRLWRIFEILRYGRREQQGLPRAELLSIAVLPAYRGQGIADQLYGRLIDYFREAGLSEFTITVGEALQPAHRFYCRMGALPVSKVEVHKNLTSVVYIQKVG